MSGFFQSLEVGPGKVLLSFALPIYQRTLDALAINGKLAKLSLDLEHTETSDAPKSNVGSWRSRGNLFTELGHNPQIVTFREHLNQCVRELICAELNLTPTATLSIRFKLDGWINVLRRGAYHSAHTHPGATWAGVYYVATGTAGAKDGGVIEFFSGNHVSLPYKLNGKPLERDRKTRIEPLPGMLLLFPGTLWHAVPPYGGVSPRITIAFNVSNVVLECAGSEEGLAASQQSS